MSTPTALGKRDLGEADDAVVRLPGTAQRCLTVARAWLQLRTLSAVVRENILLRPAGEIEQGARRKEIETGLGERDAVLALQPLVELAP